MHRFDSWTQMLASRISRRSAVTSASAGLAGGVALAMGSHHVFAQDATPAASPVPTTTQDVPFLFVQSASSATFGQAGEGGGHRLTLQGHTGGTIYFSDRPERIFGEAPTQKFIDGLGFSMDNPPNAAIVTTDLDGSGDVLVVELSDPRFDAASGELSYGVSALETYAGDGLAFAANQQQDLTLAAELGSTSLFIDDCSDGHIYCFNDKCDDVGDLGDHGMCWSWSSFACLPCGGGWDPLTSQCNSEFDACNGDCSAGENCSRLS